MNISTAFLRLAAATAGAAGVAVLSAPLAPADPGSFCLNVPFVNMCVPVAAPPPAPPPPPPPQPQVGAVPAPQ